MRHRILDSLEVPVLPPARATATLTPERKKLLAPLRSDSSRAVSAQANRLWETLRAR